MYYILDCIYYIYNISLFIKYEELAHIVIEAKKSHDLPSISRKASGVIPSPTAWEQGSQWYKSHSKGRRRWVDMTQINRWARTNWVNSSFLLLCFCSDPEWIAWCLLVLGRAVCCTEPTHPNANFIQKHPLNSSRNNIYQDTLWPVKLTHKINHPFSHCTFVAFT